MGIQPNDIWHVLATHSNCLMYQIWIDPNSFLSMISQEIHKMYEKVSTITQIWHSQMLYFTSMSNACYLIIVPNMNKITAFFEISQALKTFEKILIITQIWHRDKYYLTCISSRWSSSWYPIWRKSSNHHGGMHKDS